MNIVQPNKSAVRALLGLAILGLVGWAAVTKVMLRASNAAGAADPISVAIACGFTHAVIHNAEQTGGARQPERNHAEGAVIVPSWAETAFSGTSLDVLTMTAWEEAEEKHLFKANLTGYAERRTASIAGSLPNGMVVVGNPGRRNKRQGLPQVETVYLSTPFTEHKFHFGKINPEEILYRFAHQLDPKANNAGGSSSSGNDGEAGADPRCETYPKPGRAAATSAAHTPEHWATGHYAIINPFPLGRYSGLLAPFLQEFRNQRMRKDALIVGMAFASELKELRVGYNSIGAGASVNHLHFQFWKVNLGLPVEAAPRKTAWLIPGENSHITLSQSVGWFAPFFVWSYTSEIKTWDPTNIKFQYASYDTIAGIERGIAAVKRERIAAHAQAAIDYLTKINLPHNMILTPTELYLFPRRPTVPYTPETNPDGAHITPGFPAVAGAIIAPDTQLYEEFDARSWVRWFDKHLRPSDEEMDGVMATLRSFKLPSQNPG